jgi:hypothetical protein
MFANEYIQTAHTIPYVLEGIAVPESIVTFDRRFNKFMLILLASVGVLMFICFAMDWWVYFNGG